MNNTDRKVATGDISDMLCDGCLARLEQSLAGWTTPHEFLECLLITGKESNLERFFCPRCTEKLYELKAVLISQLESKNDTSV
jgi:hypothetical protein